jgi:membrane protease YdiL (CAAX protease family)
LVVGVSVARKYPAATYFVLTFAVSWSAALAVALPHLLRRESLPVLTGILMFPAMLLGPSLCGILMTLLTDGRNGLAELFGRMRLWRIRARWYFLLLLPPLLVLGVLLALSAVLSARYSPNFFPVGLLFGVPAGLLEEIGWMGFAFPKLCLKRSALVSGLVLGLTWSLWHLPVINFLGTATPHGTYWLSFFVVFLAAMTAMRVIISWAYVNTGSLLLAQLIHVSSTGALVIFSPPRATAAQEVLWYGIYALVLWAVVAAVATKYKLALGGDNQPAVR